MSTQVLFAFYKMQNVSHSFFILSKVNVNQYGYASIPITSFFLISVSPSFIYLYTDLQSAFGDRVHDFIYRLMDEHFRLSKGDVAEHKIWQKYYFCLMFFAPPHDPGKFINLSQPQFPHLQNREIYFCTSEVRKFLFCSFFQCQN